MKEDESACEENETPILGEVDQSLQVKGVIALGSIACAHVIDLVRSDLGERSQRWNT